MKVPFKVPLTLALLLGPSLSMAPGAVAQQPQAPAWQMPQVAPPPVYVPFGPGNGAPMTAQSWQPFPWGSNPTPPPAGSPWSPFTAPPPAFTRNGAGAR